MRFSSLAVAAAITAAGSPALADPPAAPTAPAAAPAPKKHGPRTPGVMLTVLGVAGLGTGLVFQILSSSAASSAQAACPQNNCGSTFPPDYYKAKNFNAAAVAALAAGGAVAIAGVALTIVAPGDPVADDPPKSARLAPWVAPNAAGAGFVASF